MNTKYSIISSKGQILQWGTGIVPSLGLNDVLIVFDNPPNSTQTFRWHDDEFVALKEQPSPYHSYNWDTHIWEDLRPTEWYINEAVRDVQALHDALLEKQHLTYGQLTIDADQRSLDALLGKIQELSFLGDNATDIDQDYFVWRDAKNEVQQFEDAESYLTWLRGAAAAIMNRNTDLKKQLWVKKDAIRACKTPEEVLEVSKT